MQYCTDYISLFANSDWCFRFVEARHKGFAAMEGLFLSEVSHSEFPSAAKSAKPARIRFRGGLLLRNVDTLAIRTHKRLSKQSNFSLHFIIRKQ